MRKKYIILFFISVAFWLIISEKFNYLSIGLALLVGLLTMFLWSDLIKTMPGAMSVKKFFLLIKCFFDLIVEIFKANIGMLKPIFSKSKDLEPAIVVFTPDLKSEWARVLLATCITITPGTVTVDLNPDNGQYVVHAISQEAARGLLKWSLIDDIKKIEGIVK